MEANKGIKKRYVGNMANTTDTLQVVQSEKEIGKGNSCDSSILNATFEGIVQEINGALNSNKTYFGKVFAISQLTRPEIIYNIEINDFTLVPAQINGVEV